MNEILLDAFRHTAWAMKTLIAACESVSAEELGRPALGFGSILATLNHLVLSDAGYLASLGGGRPPWLDREANDLRELRARAEETGDRWQQFLQDPTDGERLVTFDKGAYETHAVVVLVQALIMRVSTVSRCAPVCRRLALSRLTCSHGRLRMIRGAVVG